MGCGPQHREFRKEILQAMQVGVWAPTQRISKRNSTGNASWGVGPNTENFEKKFYRQCKLGCGPQHREFRKEILQAMRVGVWAPTQKLTKSQLTIMCKLAGPQQREIGFPISTDSASWGGTTIKKYFFYRN
ncbi:Nitrogen regulation protein NIFR3 [Staphylococcus aureus subsp. aureus CN1]|nr:Nitrogen regulation protein NIFR3 [Staphylococcus aureus subsp. aureus CN1]BAR08284.1 nitrogen regulation protein NIFR3 [Staphylococcus aureus]BAR11008.1 nitrogen regulation protein NIFR3 [Staphylococcus aureus]